MAVKGSSVARSKGMGPGPEEQQVLRLVTASTAGVARFRLEFLPGLRVVPPGGNSASGVITAAVQGNASNAERAGGGQAAPGRWPSGVGRSAQSK